MSARHVTSLRAAMITEMVGHRASGRSRRRLCPRPPPADRNDEREAREHVAHHAQRPPEAQLPDHRLVASKRPTSVQALTSTSWSRSMRALPGRTHPDAERFILRQPLQRGGEPLHVSRLHEDALHPVVHQLGDPGQAAGHHGQPAGHRLHQDDRDALAAPVAARDAGRHQDIGVLQGRPHLGRGERAAEPHPIAESGGADPLLEIGAVGAITDDLARDIDAGRHGPGAGIDQVPLALDLVQRADRDRPEAAPAVRSPRSCGREAGACRPRSGPRGAWRPRQVRTRPR